MYLSIDPGLTTGYALFNTDGILMRSGQIKGICEFGEVLENMLKVHDEDLEAILFETFKIFPNVPLGGSDVPAARAIGVMQWLAYKHAVRTIGVDPKYRKIGYAWSGLKKPANHAISHASDAVAIGEFWLRKNKVKPNDKP
jgi:hypothetical protein